jgi:hypothetical protein
MRRTATSSALLSLALWGALASAQPARTTDVAWARDVQGATLTLDGTLNEPAWAQAEVINVRWDNATFYTPGGGWDGFFGNFNANPVPSDPVDADVRLLRRGNILWIGVTARDHSVGGKAIDFWTGDGIIMSITDKRNRSAQPDTLLNYFNGGATDEFFFTYFGADTTAGSLPRLFGNHGDDRTLWDGVTTVQGTSNDDSDTDVGYTQEIWIDLGQLGFNYGDGDGDRLPMTFAVYDFDYGRDPGGRQFLSRAWWQNAWGGDMPYGVGFVYGRPDVTVSSGAVPAITEPELRLGTSEGTITLDGQLDEPEWQSLQPQVTLRYQPTASMLDALPGFGPYYTHWFRPGGDAPDAPAVVDPTIGQLRFFFQRRTLYVGLDTDDQAISGDAREDRGDGVRIVVRELRHLDDGDPYLFRGFLTFIDSTGVLVRRRESQDTTGQTTNFGYEAALHLKGASTIADPNDIDEGYQMELAIDLAEIPGYTGGLGDRIIYIGAAFFDGDYLDPVDPAVSYGMRTWWLTERGGGPFGGPAAATYLDPDFVITAGEPGPGGTSAAIRLLGAAPNPAADETAIRYELGRPAVVTVEVFDALGRRVAEVTPGLQAPGLNEARVDAAGLAAGAYVYRVRLEDGAMASGRLTILK